MLFKWELVKNNIHKRETLMSSTALQKNLEQFIKDGHHQIADLERKAGLSKNNIYNIVRGISKNPSADKLHAIATVLGVHVNDLFRSTIGKEEPQMTSADFQLLERVVQDMIKIAQELELKITCAQFSSAISQIFDYSVSVGGYEPDEKFIRWTLQQKFTS